MTSNVTGYDDFLLNRALAIAIRALRHAGRDHWGRVDPADMRMLLAARIGNFNPVLLKHQQAARQLIKALADSGVDFGELLRQAVAECEPVSRG